MTETSENGFAVTEADLAAVRLMLAVEATDELARYLADLHPSDIADLLTDFDPEEKARLFSLLAPEPAADVLAELDVDSREDVIEELTPSGFHKVLEELEPDEAADVIGELEPGEALEALEGLEDRREIESLLAYPPDTAGGVMTTEFIALPTGITVREALDRARGGSEDVHRDTIYVVGEDGRPVGRIPLSRLVFSGPERLIDDLVDPEVHPVPADTDREQVAEIVRRYDLLSLPVVAPDAGNMVGIVTFDDVLDVAADEAAEDMYRLAGTGATDPLHQSVVRRALLRLPWLVITLIPGFGVGQIMRWLGYETAGPTSLLLFVPVMIAMAGNVSLQSSTVIVRGLATGDVRSHRTLTILVKEIAVATLVGIVCGAIAGTVGGVFFGGWPYGVVIALSMFCGILSAAVSGTSVPLVVNRVGVDPALASGPFVTSLNDILGTLIYLGMGGAMLERMLG